MDRSIREARGIGSLTLVWGGGGGKGLGGGHAQGEGTLECRTLGGVIPRQGGGLEELAVWTR